MCIRDSAYLNQAFKEAKEQAAWLKIISFVIAGLLLWKVFETKTSIRILFIPCIAILGTIAIFGWIDLPIGLFSMFGLLLVSAIGIDYAVYMKTVNEEASHKRITDVYKRQDEADRVKQVGLQGQTDLMINELFKNN